MSLYHNQKLEKFDFFKEKNVLVLGGTGFIGQKLSEYLLNSEAYVTIVGRSNKKIDFHDKEHFHIKNFDLMDIQNHKEILEDQDYVFQLSGIAGGIEYNKNNQGILFTKNSLLNLKLLDAVANSNVERYQFVSSVATYPSLSIPLKESITFANDPPKSNFGYAWAKRISEIQCKLYANEFNLKISIVRPDNTFGPRDNFDQSQSRVIPSLITKVFDAPDFINVWGSGNQIRSFVYVDDLIRGMLLSLEKNIGPDPINIGTGEETSIKHLVELIVKIFNKKISAQYDTTKPEGEPIRVMDISKAKETLGYQPKWSLKKGLKETIDWFKNSRLE